MGVVKTEYGLCYTADTCFYQYSDFEDCGLYVGDTGKIFISQAKKIKNVYHLIYECSNLIRAQYKAQQGKGERTEITKFNENILENLDGLYWDLRNETYTPGEYRIKVIYEPKERVIMIAPFFPDRIYTIALLMCWGVTGLTSSLRTHTLVSKGVVFINVWRMCIRL